MTQHVTPEMISALCDDLRAVIHKWKPGLEPKRATSLTSPGVTPANMLDMLDLCKDVSPENAMATISFVQGALVTRCWMSAQNVLDMLEKRVGG